MRALDHHTHAHTHPDSARAYREICWRLPTYCCRQRPSQKRYIRHKYACCVCMSITWQRDKEGKKHHGEEEGAKHFQWLKRSKQNGHNSRDETKVTIASRGHLQLAFGRFLSTLVAPRGRQKCLQSAKCQQASHHQSSAEQRRCLTACRPAGRPAGLPASPPPKKSR